MERVIWTKRSLASLRKIWEFYSEKDAILADRIIEEIISTIENIQFAKQYQIEERLSKNHRKQLSGISKSYIWQTKMRFRS